MTTYIGNKFGQEDHAKLVSRPPFAGPTAVPGRTPE